MAAKKKSKITFRPTGHAKNYALIAYKYALAAIENKDNQYCKWVRLAAKRHVDELSKKWEYEYSAWHGNDICDFIEKLPHAEGSWGSPEITLEPSQVFILAVSFGWRKKSDGNRRFTRIYIEVARKNAKSTLSAGIGLYCLACEGEIGPQILLGATTGDQANKVFLPAKRMVDKTPELQEAFGVRAWAHSISCEKSGGFMQKITHKSSTNDGWNPHCGILDELHAHKDRGVFDVIRSAFGARKNPLMLMITTAGYNVHGVCYEQRRLVTNILNGIVDAPHFFGIIYTLDDEDLKDDKGQQITANLYNPKLWIKANPLLGVSVQTDEFRGYAIEAKASPAAMYEFMTKRLNIWTTAKGSWINIEEWSKGAGKVNPENLRQYACYGGLDLASTQDLTAWVLVWLIDGRLKVFPRFWVPEDTIMDRVEKDGLPYRMWVERGFITATPGNVCDYDFIQEQIEKDMKMLKIKRIGYDPWNATDLTNRLAKKRAPLIEVRQGAKSFHAPMQYLEKMYKSKKIDHGNNPVMNWMASNLVVRKDQNENMAPDKANSAGKIDGMAALLDALYCLTREPVKLSKYETEGLV